MIFLVPQLAATFKQLVPKLPRETEVLIVISNFFVRWWYLLLGIPAPLVVCALDRSRAPTSACSARVDELDAQAAGAGAELRRRSSWRASRPSFAMLYSAGISVLDCIQHLRGDRRQPRDGGRRCSASGRSISEGKGISQAFIATKLFPPLVIRMLRMGESTGALDTALLNVSYFYNREVRDGIAKMQTLLGPATTVVLGMLIVGDPLLDLPADLRRDRQDQVLAPWPPTSSTSPTRAW